MINEYGDSVTLVDCGTWHPQTGEKVMQLTARELAGDEREHWWKLAV